MFLSAEKSARVGGSSSTRRTVPAGSSRVPSRTAPRPAGRPAASTATTRRRSGPSTASAARTAASTAGPSPQDWAWLAHLGEQLERLPEDWDAILSDDDPLTTLVVEVTASLAEAGLPLYDATGAGSEIGGACLTPQPELGVIVVTWRQHDRMSVDQVHGAAADALVQQVMNRALAEVLEARGFVVDPFGGASGHVVYPTL